MILINTYKLEVLEIRNDLFGKRRCVLFECFHSLRVLFLKMSFDSFHITLVAKIG